MRKYTLLFVVLFSLMQIPLGSVAQSPCSGTAFRHFDFWIGQWDVYNVNGKKAGDSKITLILDSCVIFEEWTSASKTQGVTYAGKSFSKYNWQTKQWQQTWVDNVGGSTEFLKGSYDNNKILFETNPFPFSKDTVAIRKLTFYNLGTSRVRQHGEISKNNGISWVTEYDLEYRRKK
jgi:hypothetical protein